mgnify:CR=1 FL=1
MKKGILFVLLLVGVLVACEEESLVNRNPAPTPNNIDVSFVPFYGDSAVERDSLYTNILGNQFIIDSIRLLISDLYFVNVERDTLEEESNFFSFSTNQPENQQIAFLPGGGYNGRFMIINGLDTAAYYEAFADAEITEKIEKFKRVGDTAYNHFEIFGRLLEPNTDDSIPSIPIAYQIGTTLLTDTITTGTMAFSVDDTKDVRLVLLCDVKPALNSIDLFLNQTILTDPSDFQDFEMAKRFSDSLKFGLF